MDFCKPPPLTWPGTHGGRVPEGHPPRPLWNLQVQWGYFQLSLAGHAAATQPLLLTDLDREAPLLPTAQKLPHPAPGLRTKKEPSLL